MDRAADWIGLLFIVAIIYVLVRPGSKASQLVEAVTSFVASIVRAAVDLAVPQT